uniref:Ras-associating domain-containing protein n=1 Tax=Angiostrongylus cantonensis TaxID=6313 RepID=A0A0K0CZ59_ANGCA
MVAVKELNEWSIEHLKSLFRRLSHFLNGIAFAFLIKAQKLAVIRIKLWRTFEQKVNECSSIPKLGIYQIYGEYHHVDHIKIQTNSKISCAIVSYGFTQSLLAEKALAEIEPDCKLFAIDTEIIKGTEFTKIGRFYEPQSIIAQATMKEKVGTVLEKPQASEEDDKRKADHNIPESVGVLDVNLKTFLQKIPDQLVSSFYD